MGSIGVYVRTSTEEQNLEGQIADLKAWLGRNGFAEDAIEWFIDQKTGKSLDRKEMNRLRAAIFDGTIRTVVCWKLDRLSRKLLEGLTLLAEWTARGVRVVATTQQIDLAGIPGQLVATVLFAVAQMENEYREERQAVGIKVAKQRGVYKGRKVGTTKKEPRRARELRGKGLRIDEIATALGTSARTVHRYLKVGVA